MNGRNLELDEEKIAEEAKYDGYYSIVTSELNLSDTEIRNIYRGLARIEDSLRSQRRFSGPDRFMYGQTNTLKPTLPPALRHWC